MATVVLAESAVADLERLIVTRSLPATARQRVRKSLEPLAAFPMPGPGLTGRWQGLRFILGPWSWMLVIYVYDEGSDQVSIVTIEDARSARAATLHR